MTRCHTPQTHIPRASVGALLSRSILVLVTLCACEAPTVAAQTDAHPWVQLTKGDLAAMHELLLENHPGPVDPLNPDYRNWLEGGYQQALAKADSVYSLDGLMAVLSFYTSGFDDGHLAWGAVFGRTDMLWPGFVVALRAGRFLVDHVAPWAADEGIVEGAEVLTCAGKSLHDRLVDDVMPYQEGIPTLEASRVRLAPRVLIDDLNPFVARPRQCRFRNSQSAEANEVALTWRSIARDAVDSLVARAAYGTGVRTFGIQHPADDVAWITLPSFAENVGDNKAGLERVIAELPDVRDDRLIVFDVRGNGGGNSAWGGRVLSALFGDAYIHDVAAKVSGHEYVEWRASTGNADFIEQYTLPRYEPGSEGRAWLEKLITTLRNGVKNGKELVQVPDDEPSEPQAPETSLARLPLGERVILLTDGWCASACLDFADLLLAIPGVRHAGAPTYADAVYIDNRGTMLPSRIGWFTFSMKVYRDRPRGNNQPYVPSLRYTGAQWDTAALQQWLLSVAR